MRDLVKNSTKTAVFALGGLGEVGKNMYCIEHGDSIIILDSGVMFGDEYLPGVDFILPDYSDSGHEYMHMFKPIKLCMFKHVQLICMLVMPQQSCSPEKNIGL